MDDKSLELELKTIFMQEAKERLNSIINSLIQLTQKNETDDSKELIEAIFRDMHSLKGASRSIGLTHLESYFHLLETYFSGIKTGKQKLNVKYSEILLDSMNLLDETLIPDELNSLDNRETVKKLEIYFNEMYKTEEDSNPSLPDYSAAQQSLTTEDIDSAKEDKTEIKCELPNLKPAAANEPKPSSLLAETVRVNSSKLDSLLLKSENLIKIKQMFQENADKISRILPGIDSLKNNYYKCQSQVLSLKENLNSGEFKNNLFSKKNITDIVDFLESFDKDIKTIRSSIIELLKTEKESFRASEKMIDSFLYDIKNVAMLPFSNILGAFPRMVKDIAKELKKEVKFQISGEDIQIDRRILQEIKDPLIHIVRNAVDHGIEKPEERKKSNKPESGLLSLSVSQTESNKIEIIIEDDGKGIDENAVRKKLLKDQILNEEHLAKLSKEELISYLFFSGFSTKEIITDISGRGLGLAIVKDKLEKLSGGLSISSEFNKGTSFKLFLPVSLSTFKGVLVEVNTRVFAVPSINVEKIIRVKNPSLKKIKNRESLIYDNTTYPLIDLCSLLNISNETVTNEEALTIVIIEKNNKFMALKIDNVIEEQELLVKDLGCQLKKVNNITAATILNSGQIVPILNISDLFLNSQNISYSKPQRKDSEPKDAQSGKQSKSITRNILVVEDSVTSRMLIKNILEAAHYNVQTAVDGLAALTLLKTNHIDLVVSDIEMPRMNGFIMTEKIKQDQKLSSIPVILVSSLSSDEDKEKGVEAGADAYIVKSQFDQSNLLGTIEMLLS